MVCPAIVGAAEEILRRPIDQSAIELATNFGNKCTQTCHHHFEGSIPTALTNSLYFSHAKKENRLSPEHLVPRLSQKSKHQVEKGWTLRGSRALRIRPNKCWSA
jgi:hypothetical protein